MKDTYSTTGARPRTHVQQLLLLGFLSQLSASVGEIYRIGSIHESLAIRFKDGPRSQQGD